MTDEPLDPFRALRGAVGNLLATAVRFARAAQADFSDAYRLLKVDASPVTIADVGVQAIVCHYLRGILDAPVLAEEDVELLRDRESAFAKTVFERVARIRPSLTPDRVVAAVARGGNEASDLHWVLDPIDGTKGFLRGGHYAIALGLVETGQPVFGALACPAMGADGAGLLLSAGRGEGAWERPEATEDPEWTQIHASTADDPTALRFVESVEKAHTAHDAAAQIRDRLGSTADSVRMDSQAKYAAVARGDAEVYLRLPTRKDYAEKAWDHAAGAIVVMEAGGRVTDVDGKDLDFSAPTLVNNRGVVATNGPCHDAVVAAIRAVL